jgi:hypothetical protein
MPPRNRDLPSVVYLIEESVPQSSEGKPIEFDDHYLPDYLRPPFRSWKPIRAFTRREAAEDYCRELETQERDQHNPFTWGERLSDVTSLDEPRLRDWLLDAGLTPPEETPPEEVESGVEPALFVWIAWWEETAAHMSDLQRQRVLEATDKVRLFRVTEVTR